MRVRVCVCVREREREEERERGSERESEREREARNLRENDELLALALLLREERPLAQPPRRRVVPWGVNTGYGSGPRKQVMEVALAPLLPSPVLAHNRSRGCPKTGYGSTARGTAPARTAAAATCCSCDRRFQISDN